MAKIYCYILLVATTGFCNLTLAEGSIDCKAIPNVKTEFVGPILIEKAGGKALFVKLRVTNNSTATAPLILKGNDEGHGLEIWYNYEYNQFENGEGVWEYEMGLPGSTSHPPPDKVRIAPGTSGEVLASIYVNAENAKTFQKFRVVISLPKNECIVSDPFLLNILEARKELGGRPYN